jgi:hypothetical protein
VAKITIVKDNCKTCRNTFRYEYTGGPFREFCDSHVMTIRYVAPIKTKVEPKRDTPDEWLIASPVKKSSKTKTKVRIGNCQVCKNDFEYVGRGRDRKRCDAHPRTAVGVRKSTCEVCNVNFEYQSPGRPRIRCDDHPKEKVQSSRVKAKTPEEIVDQLMKDLAGRGLLLSQQTNT